MQDEGVIYVAGHPLLNRRCTRLLGCIRLRNDLYCVELGVKLYTLTHSLVTLSVTTLEAVIWVIRVNYKISIENLKIENDAYEEIYT